EQIECFHKTYVLYPMHAVAKNEKTHNKRLDKWDDNASLVALKKFQEMKALIQNKLNLCFLRIIDASMHATEFKDGTPKAYLTTQYKFGVSQFAKKLAGYVSNHAISFLTTLNAFKFIANFANQYGFPSP
ncbi:8889_t:CDS:2, partial [Gigaspora rosea]